MQSELLELQENMKKTIIFITHDLDESLRIGDRIALMKDGKVIQIGSPEEIMMNPANEYVERFVEDVDLSKVLLASHIQKRAERITPDRGPRVALQIMRDQGYSSIFVVDRKQKLLGAITAEDASDAIKENKTVEEVMQKDIVVVSEDTVLTDVIEALSTSPLPIAVVDPEHRLKGVIIRGAVIGALAGHKEDLNLEEVK
jgi:glycine betaine/proline transport system ATP-binding protein